MFKRAVCFYIVVIGLSLVSNCFASSDSNLPYKEGELLIRFAPKSKGVQKTLNERNLILSSFNAGWGPVVLDISACGYCSYENNIALCIVNAV